MKRPLLDMPADTVLTKKDIQFVTPKIKVSPHHTEGYWLLLRKQIWELESDFIFKVRGYRIKARAGTLTDFASVPKVLWPVYAPTDSEWNKSVLAHDILYSGEIFYKALNDRILKQGMAKEGSSEATQFNFYNAVKLCGWTAYLGHTEKSITEARKHIEIVQDAL